MKGSVLELCDLHLLHSGSQSTLSGLCRKVNAAPTRPHPRPPILLLVFFHSVVAEFFSFFFGLKTSYNYSFLSC